MNGSKTLLQTGTIWKRCAKQEYITSRPVEIEMDYSKLSPSTSGYFGSSQVSAAPADSKWCRKLRKYYSSYVNFGFSWRRTKVKPRSQCVVSGNVTNESM